MPESTYRYVLHNRYPSQFKVVNPVDGKVLGYIERTTQPAGRKRAWRCELWSDPGIEGYGRTKDRAVEGALSQVGGLG